MTSKALPWLMTLVVFGAVVVPLAVRPPVVRDAPPTSPLAPPAGGIPAATKSELAPADPTPTRARATPNAPTPASLPRAFAEETVWTLDVLVLDPDDQPLSGARVYLAPIELPLDSVGWTDARGRLQLQFAAALDTQRVVVASEHARYGCSPLRVIELTPRPYHLAIELRPAPDAPRFAAEDAGAIFDAHSSAPSPLDPRAGAEETQELAHAGVDSARIDERGRLRFTQLLESLPGTTLDAPRGWTLPEPAPLFTRDFDPRDGSLFVKGVVRDALGARVADARVRAHDAERQLEFSTRSFQDGSFGLGPLPSRGMQLSIGGGDFGRYETSLSGAGNRFQSVQAALSRARELSGTLTDESSLPLSNWRLEVRDSSGASAWADVAWTDARGRFSVPNAPSTMLRVDVFAPDGGGGFPVLSERGLWAQPECLIAVPASALESSMLRVQVASAEGVLVDDAEVRLESEAGDHAACAVRGDVPGEYVARGIPAGRYRVTIHHRGDRSVVWPEMVEIEVGGVRDLGMVVLERRAVLAVEADPALGVMEYSVERRVGAWRVLVGVFEVRGRWLVRVGCGEYVVTARGGAGERVWEVEVDSRVARVVRVGDVRER